MLLDSVADVAEMDAGFYHFNADFQALMADASQPLGGNRGCADKEHLAGVAMEAVLDNGDVYINGITFFNDLVAGYAVADDVINRGANRFREAAVIERCRDCLLHFD